jgi:hypothetical protein
MKYLITILSCIVYIVLLTYVLSLVSASSTIANFVGLLAIVVIICSIPYYFKCIIKLFKDEKKN